MLSKLRPRFTYANVMSTIACFVAMGGTAYAVGTIGSADIIDESILSADLKNGEVKSADVASSSITSAKIYNGSVINSELGANAVTSNKVLDETLTGADIAESSLGKVGDADTLDGKDGTKYLSADAAIAFAKVDAGDATLEDIPADQRTGVVGFSHAPGSFYCFDLTANARVGSATPRYDGGGRFPRLNVPGSAFCPEGFRDASVVFASTFESSVDQGFDVVFHP